MEANTLFVQPHSYPGTIFQVIRMETGTGKNGAPGEKTNEDKPVKRMTWEDIKQLRPQRKVLRAKTGASGDPDTAAKASRSRAAQIIAEAFGRMEKALFGDGEK